MFKYFIITIFSCFSILCFQGVSAEQGTENDFKDILTCFRALKGKTYYNPDRYVSGYFEEVNIAVLPHPLNSHTWLFVTENAIYQQLFGTSNKSYSIYRDGLLETSNGYYFELPLPNGQRLHLVFNYKQYSSGGPIQPSLGVSLVKNKSQTCDLPVCTTLTPHETDNKEFITDALRDRIQTIHKHFLELNYQNHPADDFISALNACTGIDEGLDSVIAQEIEKF